MWWSHLQYPWGRFPFSAFVPLHFRGDVRPLHTQHRVTISQVWPVTGQVPARAKDTGLMAPLGMQQQAPTAAVHPNSEIQTKCTSGCLLSLPQKRNVCSSEALLQQYRVVRCITYRCLSTIYHGSSKMMPVKRPFQLTQRTRSPFQQLLCGHQVGCPCLLLHLVPYLAGPWKFSQVSQWSLRWVYSLPH